MGLLSGFMSTASKALSWVGNAVDYVADSRVGSLVGKAVNSEGVMNFASGAAQGYGAYAGAKQTAKAQKDANKIQQQSIELQKQQLENEQRRWDSTHGVINAYDNSIPSASSQHANTTILSGSMADALKNGGNY